jgi:hypothetical protein
MLSVIRQMVRMPEEFAIVAMGGIIQNMGPVSIGCGWTWVQMSSSVRTTTVSGMEALARQVLELGTSESGSYRHPTMLITPNGSHYMKALEG